MFKFQLSTAADRKEAAIIAQKRRFEDDRKKRIFDARNRIIGVDVEALAMQVAERQKFEHVRREEENQFNAEDKRRANILNVKADELTKERHRVENEINEYRRKYQKKEDTREFDLNDPRRMQNATAARIGDDDPRLGISSAQKFEGEDLMCPERLRVQRDQQRAWLQQQMQERRTADNDRLQAESLQQKALEARDRRAQEMDQAERRARDQIRASAAEFNRTLAEAQACKKETRRREEQEDNLAEIYNNLTSDMLTENRTCAESNFGVKRKITANYRGMTDDELLEFIRAQDDQKKQHIRQVNESKALDAKWDQMANSFARMNILKERELDRKRTALEKQLMEENTRMAEEQKERNRHMDKVVFTNRPTMEYFSQFNTSTR